MSRVFAAEGKISVEARVTRGHDESPGRCGRLSIRISKQPRDEGPPSRDASAPGFWQEATLVRTEGAGNAGCWPQPMARLQQEKQAAVTTGPAESSGIPCAMVLTLIARSPWGPGFLAPIVPRIATARRSLSVGRPGPHAFASATSHVRPHEEIVRAAHPRPPHPALNVRDDREAPLWIECGTARIMLPICGKSQAPIPKITNIFAVTK